MRIDKSPVVFAGLAAAVLSTAHSQAQDWRLDPDYGTISLEAGFTPDPHNISLQSGGSIDAQLAIGQACAGYIGHAPLVRLHYEARFPWPLILSVASASDTTLIVNMPDGNWACDDDGGNGFNPSIRLERPTPGQYDIWIGTYGEASYHDATLSISELTSN